MEPPAAHGPTVARVVTNETCNQNCGFCKARRPAERAPFVAAAAVRARIEAAARGGARQVVLTGGEPTLRRDLPALVVHARAAGAGEVVLETNGALIDGARAAALARAGLGAARIHLPRWGEELDAITRDPGGFARTRAALRALAGAGVAVEVAVPVVRANLDAVAGVPDGLAAEGVRVRALLIEVPVSAPDEGTLAPLAEAARAVEALEAAARRAGIPARFDAESMIPPCLFPQPSRVAHLYALTPGGAARADHMHVEACGPCEARGICPGVPREALRREPGLAIRPIPDDRTRRRLTLVSSVEDQIARELVTRDVRRLSDGTTARENIVRVNFHCNQVCRFCFVSTHLPPGPEAAIEAAIEEIGRERGVLTLSGGEPTLNPRLVEYVAMGKRAGAREVELQTNAIRLADPALVQRLVEAGLDVAFVSLHASEAEVSDRITGAPGTFAKTVLGIDALARTPVALRLNFVFCEESYRGFEAYVEMVGARWPSAWITVSFVAASTDLVPLDREMMPRYADVMPHLAAGVRAARRLGVELTGFESMCGIPLCLVPDDLSPFFVLAEAPEDLSPGEFLKPEACRECVLGAQCFGVRRGYARLHGVEELAPIRAVAEA
jgi:MoaA/NifB/PqqE/SkfB family radical SAM enzyme